MATSGTVSTTVFETRKVIDRAFGRCKLAPQQISGEYIDIAEDLLYLLLSGLATKGLPLWAVEKIILPIYDATAPVPCPASTVDMLNCNLRTITQIQTQTGAIYTSSAGGTASNAFDNNLSTACTQVAPNGYIQVQFTSAAQPVVFGLLPNATGTWNYSIQTSNDGVVFTTVYSTPTVGVPVSAGQWIWTDIQGIPETGVLYIRLQASSGTTLNVTEFVCGTNPQEIPLAKINRDDYANLPNKFFGGRPTQFWFDKQFGAPIITLWPSPQAQFTYAQIVCYIHQYIQDVGLMTQSLAIPQRWFQAVFTELARQLCSSIPEVQPGMLQEIAPEAEALLRAAWQSESDGSPILIRPMIRSYTR